LISKIAVIREGIAVNQGPTSPLSFHVTINLKWFTIACEFDPVNSWNCWFVSCKISFTRLGWVWFWAVNWLGWN
jgi:hypothetical protein